MPLWLNATAERGLAIIVMIGAMLILSSQGYGQGMAGVNLSPEERAKIFVLGGISSDPKGTFPRLETLANHLASELRPLGIESAKVVVAGSANELIDLLRNGAIDAFSATSFLSVHFEDTAGSRIFLKEWKRGADQYYSILFTRQDKRLSNLSDLKGKRIVFETRGSTTGFLLPLAMLKQAGLTLRELTGPSDQPNPDEVGFSFAVQEVNVAAWVARGLADAGAASIQDWESFSRTPDSLKSRLVIFFESEPLARSFFSIRGNLDPSIAAKLKETLLTMDRAPKTLAILNAYYGVSRYEDIDSAFTQDRLRWVRELYPLVKDEIR